MLLTHNSLSGMLRCGEADQALALEWLVSSICAGRLKQQPPVMPTRGRWWFCRISMIRNGDSALANSCQYSPVTRGVADG